MLAEQPRLCELKLLNCPMLSGSIVEQLPPQPLRLTLSGCTLAPLHIMILEARGVADKVDVAVCLNCTQVTEKRGQFKCGGCGEDRCSAPMSSMPSGRPLPCDDTTRCGACELVLCFKCDDRKHKCCCCDDVFCNGCVGKSEAAISQLCAFCEEEAYGECVSFTCSECDHRGCEGCRDDYTDACATCNKQICRECREEQDGEYGQWWTTCVCCEALQCPACHSDWDCEDCGKTTCSACSGARVAKARCLRGRAARDGEALPQPVRPVPPVPPVPPLACLERPRDLTATYRRASFATPADCQPERSCSMCDTHSDGVCGTRCGDECCPGYSKHACAVCAAPLCTACAEPCMSCGESGTPAAVFCGDCCPPAADCCPKTRVKAAAPAAPKPAADSSGEDDYSGEEELDVSSILEERRSGGESEFLVRLEPEAIASWEHEDKVAVELVAGFRAKVKKEWQCHLPTSLARPYRQLALSSHGPTALPTSLSTSGAVPPRSAPVHHETLVRLDLPRPLRCFGCSSVCCDTCSVLMHSCSVCDVSACEECLGWSGGTVPDPDERRDRPPGRGGSRDLPACDWNLCPCCDTWQCVACTFDVEWAGMPTRVGRKRMSAERCLQCTDMGAELPKPAKQVPVHLQFTSRYGASGLPLDAKAVGKSVRAALRGHPELTMIDIQEHLETKLGDLTAWQSEIREATLVFTLAKAQKRLARAQAAVDEFNARLQSASGAEAAAGAYGASGDMIVSRGYVCSSESEEEKE